MGEEKGFISFSNEHNNITGVWTCLLAYLDVVVQHIRHYVYHGTPPHFYKETHSLLVYQFDVPLCNKSYILYKLLKTRNDSKSSLMNLRNVDSVQCF